MKKILTILASLFLTAAPITSVASCSDNTKDVVLYIDGSTASKTSGIVLAYKQIVKDFNDNCKIDACKDVHLQVKTPPAGQIWNMLNSGESLPDLYITYSDNVTTYMDLDGGKFEQHFDDKFLGKGFFDDHKIIRQSYLNEGQINGIQYIIPASKSFDISVMNLRLLLEFLHVFKITKYDDLIRSASGYKDKEQLKESAIFTNVVKDIEDSSKYDEMKDIVDKIMNTNPPKTVLELKRIFQTYGNLKEMMKSFSFIVQEYDKSDKVDNEEKARHDAMYFLGIDDVSNNVYDSFVARSKKANISGGDYGFTMKQDNEFFYDYNWDTSRFHINLKEKDNPINDFIDLLNNAKKLEEPGSDNHNGTLFLLHKEGVKSKYSSDIFVKGNILMSDGSSAGSAHYQSDPKLVKEESIVTNDDILVIPTPNAAGESWAVQQGPAIAGFNSSNKDKEAVKKAFIEFMFSPERNTEFALLSGYLPTLAESYRELDEIKDTTKSPTPYMAFITLSKEDFEKQYGKYPSWVPEKKLKKGYKDDILAQIVRSVRGKNEKYNDPRISDDLKIFTIEASPLGSNIRKEALQKIITTMYEDLNLPAEFLDMKTFINGKPGENTLAGCYKELRNLLTTFDPRASEYIDEVIQM